MDLNAEQRQQLLADHVESLGITVFFSYARKDKALRDQLETHLSLLQRQAVISSWQEYQVTPGKPRAKEIDTHLQTAHIILLLISPDFIAADYCYSHEMNKALERDEAGEAHVIPILLRPTAGWQTAPFGKLAVLPSNGKPVTAWRNRDLAFVNIVDGIRRVIEQVSVKIKAAQTRQLSYRSILELPPPLHPKTIQPRERVVQDIYAQLIQSDTTALMLTGIAGAGKSSLANLVYHYAEQQRQTGSGLFTATALWLRIDPAVTMIDLVGTLFEALSKPSPYVSNLTPQDLAILLFNTLNSVDQPRLVVLDQFENLLDPEKGCARSADVEEWLHLLNAHPCHCRVLLTSRVWPPNAHDALHLRDYPVPGLETTEVMGLLRSWEIDVTTPELHTLVARWQGHPQALMLLASLLHNQRLSLAAFFEEHMDAQPRRDISHFLEYIYMNQLDSVQRSLLFAFSVYREPVSLPAAQALLDKSTKLSSAQLQAALDRLLVLQLLQARNGHYQLHGLIADFARNHLVEGDEQANREALRRAHAKAALYYQQEALLTCPPQRLRRRISDVHDLVEAIWHWCQAEQWQEAYTLLSEEHIFPDLKRWGGTTTLFAFYQEFLPLDKWHPEPVQAARCSSELGEIYNRLGQKDEAQQWLEQALSLFRQIGDREGEARTLNNLGEVYNALGWKQQARACYEQVLSLCEEKEDLADTGMKGVALNNLGRVYQDLGQEEQALKYYEQALPFHTDVSEEATTLQNLGGLDEKLGRLAEAQRYYQKALRFFQEIGDRRGEGTTLNNLGMHWKKQGKKEEAQEYYEQALRVFREIGDRFREALTLRNLGQLYLVQDHYGPARYKLALACIFLANSIFKEMKNSRQHEMRGITTLIRQQVGEQQFETLRAEVESQAAQIVEQALHESF